MRLSEYNPARAKIGGSTANPIKGNPPLIDADEDQLVRTDTAVAGQNTPLRKSAVAEESPAFVTIPPLTQKADEPEYIRLGLPSHFIFYPFKEMFYRPFDVNDLMKLYRAHANKNYSDYVDIIDGVCTQDVRMLSPPDFEFLLYRLRIDSYPETPHEITWTSRYGNSNVVSVTNSNLTIKEIELTQAEYDEWQRNGFCMTTMRDQEHAHDHPDWPAEEKWLFRMACFMIGNGDPKSKDYYASKLAALKAGGTKAISTIHRMGSRFEHGVEDTIKVVDAKYDPHKALPKLEVTINILRLHIEQNNRIPDSVFMLLDEMEQEAQQLRTWLAAEDKSNLPTPEPREETAKLAVDLTAFFLDL